MINIQIKATGFSLTPAVEEYVRKKFEGIERINEETKEHTLYIEVGKTTMHHKAGDFYRAEATMHIKDKDIRAISETQDIYASIDKVKDDVFRELTTTKEKKETLWRKGSRQIKKLLRLEK